MAQVTTLDKPQPVVKVSRPTLSVGLISLLGIICVTSLVLYRAQPPAAVPATAPPTEFASGRAMQHLQRLALTPHPLGSAEHDATRDYIVQTLNTLGLDPQIQKTTGINQKLTNPVTAGMVENIVARLKGTDNHQPILLVSHYDSVSTGPGASDDGASVAAMLETARALKVSAPLKNDVVFLFTDGEEAGLLGANAFVAEQPATAVGAVLNFEARGSSGPAYMFETSRGNEHLITALAQAAPRPAASSLMYEVYKLLPNDTDLSVFKQAQWPGLNFAFINQSTHYHTQLDNIENIDERSLQQQGSYALALARGLGNTELTRTTRDAVYFDLLSALVVRYPASWVMPLTVLMTLAVLAVVGLGLKKKRLRMTGIGWGVLALLASMGATWLSVSLVWWLVSAVHRQYRLLAGDTYNSALYLVSFVALTAAVTIALYALFLKRVAMLDLWAGALVGWLLLLIPAALLLPGSSYLFTWPLCFSLLALGLTLAVEAQADARAGRLPLLFLGATVGAVLFIPVVQLLFVGLTVSKSGLVMLAVALLLGLFVPQINLMTMRRQWLLPAGLLLLSLSFIAAGSMTAGASKSRPQRDSIFYGLDANTGHAVWASTDAQADVWTAQFLPQATRRNMAEFFPLRTPELLAAAAPAAQLAAPNVELLADQQQAGVRSLRLKITSPRRAPIISIGVESDGEVQGTMLNGKRLELIPAGARPGSAHQWGLRYYALPAEGIELTLETKSQEPLTLKVVDQSYGLPALPGVVYQPRPAHLIPAAVPFTDSTLVSRSFTL
ncbi:MAG: hypothetical protein DMF64_21855 [Acidobacteria bacterium]|nr:MAG: hypothetical protein DMF64_21855 [Acidobacteriota bacterium]